VSEKILQVSDLPMSFRTEVMSEIEKKLDKNDGLQLVALPGMGASSLGMQLASNFKFKYRVNYVNLNLLLFGDGEELLLKLKKGTSGNDPVVFYLDPFDRLAKLNRPDILSLLMGWRQENYGKIKYIFTLEQEVTKAYELKNLEPLISLIVQDRYFLPPLNKSDGGWFARSVASLHKLKIEKEEEELIWKLSGGHMQLIKRLVCAKSRGVVIETMEKIAPTDSDVIYQLERILATGNFCCPVMNNYLKSKLDKNVADNLTCFEEKLLKFLNRNQNKICSRDQIIMAVWGEDGLEKVNDHALDQLIHRLRKKLETTPNLGRLEIIRGRGVKLQA